MHVEADRDRLTARITNRSNRAKRLEAGWLELVDQTSASWNRVVPWMRQLERLRRV